jgi:four helix bundle suffix protein
MCRIANPTQLHKYIKVLQDNFAKNGGLREKMAKIRKETRSGGEGGL